MKNIDWDKVYGPQTESFHNVLVDAFNQKERPVKQKRYSLILVMAGLMVALAATAYAVANRAGLVDFLGNWIVDTNHFTHNPSEYSVLLSADHDDIEVSVNEAMGDGITYVFSSTVSLKDGVRGTLRPAYICEEAESGAAHNHSTEYPIYYVDISIAYEGHSSEASDYSINPDGSISFSCFPTIDPFEENPNMQCKTVVSTVLSADTLDLGATTVYSDEFILQSPTVIEQLRLGAIPVSLGNSGVTITDFDWLKTEMGSYVRVHYSFTGGEGVNYELPTNNGVDGIDLRIKTANDSVLPMLPLPSLGANWVGGTEYTGIYRADFDDIPDRITIEVFSLNTGAVYGVGDIHLSD